MQHNATVFDIAFLPKIRIAHNQVTDRVLYLIEVLTNSAIGAISRNKAGYIGSQ